MASQARVQGLLGSRTSDGLSCASFGMIDRELYGSFGMIDREL